MTRPVSRRFFVQKLASVLPLAATGCGSLFYGERHGRPHSGKIDKKVFFLDCCGLVLFGIGGLIALAIDFSNGTIYLPRGQASTGKRKSFFGRREEDLVAIQLPRDEFTRENIERVASEHFGEPVSLADRKTRRKEIRSLREFFPAARRMFGHDNLIG